MKTYKVLSAKKIHYKKYKDEHDNEKIKVVEGKTVVLNRTVKAECKLEIIEALKKELKCDDVMLHIKNKFKN